MLHEPPNAADGRWSASSMMTSAPFRPRAIAMFVLGLIAAFAPLIAAAAEPPKVLLLHSFGRDVAPYATIASAFRSELGRGRTEPIAVYEVSLDAVHTVSAEDDAPFVELLRHRLSSAAPDIVVTFGPPAASFFLRNRDRLFPGTPMLLAAVDERILLRSPPLRSGDSAVVGRLDLPSSVDNILQLLPKTRTIAVVVGNSPLERFWVTEAQRELAPFSTRVTFEWLNSLSFQQVRSRVSALPPHSAVLYTIFTIDAAGIPFEGEDALISLHGVSTAPIFALYESGLGVGSVGGPYRSQRRAGEVAAAVANQMLSGSTPAKPVVLGLEPPVYDWRELKRWGINAARLPSGSEVRFRTPSLWQEHRALIVAVSLISALQTALLLALVWQRNRRRRAEEAAQTLSGRLIDAHEDERRWLARELHDDITQRLAGLAIDAAHLHENDLSPGSADVRPSIRGRLAQLSEDVHDLSYRLHPSVLDDLGLVEALKAECDRVVRTEAVHVELEADRVPLSGMPREVALCVYRVAQEALRNVVRHAKASSVQLSLVPTSAGVRLIVSDNGSGYDPDAKSTRHSLGQASMRERLRLLGGQLQIQSCPGRGTTVIAWIPVREPST